MHKQISLLLIITCGILHAQQQRGPPPPPGYFQHGRGGQQSPSSGYPPYQQHQQQPFSPYKKPPGKISNGPNNIMGWLGSQMAKLPSLAGYSRPRPPYHYSHQKYKQGGQGGGKLPVIFSSPAPSKYGGGGHSLNSLQGGGGDISHIYMPPGSTTPSASMTPQNTIFQIIAADGSSRYQASPPEGYENFFSGGGQQHSNFPRSQPPPPAPRPTMPIYTMDQVVQQQGQQGQTIYYQDGPSQQPIYGSKSAGNIELIPSKMISYEKQTLSTGHPEYQAAVDGMVTAASASNGYPVYYQHQQQQFPNPSVPGNYQYMGQQVKRIDENVGSMLNGVAPDVAPILDLSTMQGQGQGQQQFAVPEGSRSIQQPIYVQAPEDAGAASFYNQDTQADYSHQAVSVVAPPANFQYQGQPIQGQGQPQDLQVAESNNVNQQVHILNHGAADGNPTFEVIAGPNAPTYDGGHPFDINQLISMIEPGAQVDPKDIVSEDQENAGSNNSGYAVEGGSLPASSYDTTSTTTTTQQ